MILNKYKLNQKKISIVFNQEDALIIPPDQFNFYVWDNIKSAFFTTAKYLRMYFSISSPKAKNFLIIKKKYNFVNT